MENFWLYLSIFICESMIMIFLVLAIWVVISHVLNVKQIYQENDYGFTNWQKFLIKLLNPLMPAFGKLPVWILPDDCLSIEKDAVKSANKLFYLTKLSLSHIHIPRSKKILLIKQASIIPPNIVLAVWKLVELRRVERSIERHLEKDNDNRTQITNLSLKIRSEIKESLDILASIPILITKISSQNNYTEVDKIAHQIYSINQKLGTLVVSNYNPTNFYNEIPRIFFYLGVFVTVVLTISIVSLVIPDFAIPIVLISSIIAFIAISLFQLRAENLIGEKAFVSVLIELIGKLGNP